MKKMDEFEGKIIIFTAPSGSGKTTIVRHLLKKYDFLGFSVSATNRKKRKKEIDGKDYYFLSSEKFQRKIDEGAFIEWEEVYDNQYYGTLKSEIERLWSKGKHVVFDIEVKGASNIKKIYPDNSVAVFVRPPSMTELRDRLTKRNTESESSLQKRLARAKEELTYENKFDTIIINDLLEVALEEAEQIIETFCNT
jgi:guanylate kinase